MDNSAQNTGQPTGNQNLDQPLQNQDLNQPIPPVINSTVDQSQSGQATSPGVGPVASDQPVFMGPTEDSSTPQPQSSIVNNIPSISNTPPPVYGSSGGGARRIATALFGIFMLAVLGVGGYFAQQQLLNPRKPTDSSAATIGPGDNPNCVTYYRYSCSWPAVNFGEGCPNPNWPGTTEGPFNSNPGFSAFCGVQQIDCVLANGDSYWVNTNSTPENQCNAAPSAPPTQPPSNPGGQCASFCDPGGPWYGTCCDPGDSGAHCQHTWTDGFWEGQYAGGCNTRPTDPPVDTPTAQCTGIKAYDAQWNVLTNAQLTQLKTGDVVRFTVLGVSSNNAIDRARFAINGTAPVETATKKDGTNEFYYEYTIPAGMTTFNVEAEVHHTTLGWK